MLDIAEHRRALMLENLTQLEDRIDWIQEECIILYLNSFIGKSGGPISTYQFSNIIHIRLSTVTGILNREVKFRTYQQRRWCCCIGIQSLMSWRISIERKIRSLIRASLKRTSMKLFRSGLHLRET